MRNPLGGRVRSTTIVAAGFVGVVLVVVAAVLLAHRRTLPTAFATTTARPAAAGATTDAPEPSVSRTGVTPAAATVVTAPSSLRLPTFAVTAPVVPVTSSAGRLDPPTDPGRVGWWLASAPPGSRTGTTVLVGHVDGPGGPGALYRLVHLQPDDAVIVADRNGVAVTYRVTSLQYIAKTDRLPAGLFDQSGPARLVLISCGGGFDRQTDEYADNVVVSAVPA